MNIFRAADAGFLNRVANHPAVRPFLGGTDILDLSPAVASDRCLVLQGEYGGMWFLECTPGCCEIHTLILPDGRGPWALAFAHAAVDWLFSKTIAHEVFTRVPEGNIGALALTRACGARLEQDVVQDIGSGPVKVSIYGGRIQDWIKTASHLPTRGHEFHVKLQQKYAAMGVIGKTHPNDAWHDRHVGAAVGMIQGGQIAKGVVTFNRWAAMALAPAMRIVSQDPLVLDISDCRIEVNGDDFEIVPGSVG